MPQPLAPSSKRPRDLRLDFFRGLALLIIVYDHVLKVGCGTEGIPAFLEITPVFWGLTCAASMFVFISGQVYGLAYGSLLDRQGFTPVVAKSWRRVAQLYAANLLTFVLMWGAIHAEKVAGLPHTDFAENLRQAEMQHGRFGVIVAIARFAPVMGELHFLDTLPLYMVLVAAGPILLWGLSRRPALTLGASALLYAGAQFGLAPPYERLGVSRLFFNPLAWQFLFLLGMATQRLPFVVRRNRTLVALGLAVIAVVAARSWLAPKLLALGWLPESAWFAPVERWDPELRTNLPWERLLYFAILAYLVGTFTSARREIWERRAVGVITRAGRNALLLFCSGSVLTWAAIPVVQAAGRSWVVAVVAIAAAFAVMLLAVAAVERWRRPSPIVTAPARPVAPNPGASS